MPADKLRNEFVVRLIVPTAMMAAALWYLGSLWDARMREQNLILIQPVVIAMIPFYVWVVVFELRRYRTVRAGAGPACGQAPANSDHLRFMAICVVSFPLFYLFGAVPATLVALGASLFTLGMRRPIALIGTSVMVTAVLWLVFVELFGIRMPLVQSPW
jgi:hypothetical protein